MEKLCPECETPLDQPVFPGIPLDHIINGFHAACYTEVLERRAELETE